jgi:hypothetical protein
MKNAMAILCCALLTGCLSRVCHVGTVNVYGEPGAGLAPACSVRQTVTASTAADVQTGTVRDALRDIQIRDNQTEVHP